MKIEIKNISKSFLPPGALLFGHKEKTVAVRDFSLDLASGESVGIVGESGSGKTTVAKMMAGFLEPDSGSIVFDGTPISSIRNRERANLVQMVFQDPFASLNPKLILGTQLVEGMRKARLAALRDREFSLLMDVGLSPDYLNRYPHQLSGGQRQRFAIGRALSMEPKLLIADEPVSSLDLSVQAQMINLLNELRARHGFIQLLISHDLAVVASLCTRVVVMKKGEIVESGEVNQILTTPAHPYTRQLLDATPVV